MTKRISTITANWPLIFEYAAKDAKTRLKPHKLLADKYSKEILGKPAELPEIDWNVYKKKISASNMVDSFQKAYESLKIPYPSDKGLLTKVEKVNAKLYEHADRLHKKAQEGMKKCEEELQEMEKIMRFSDMTMEEFFMAKSELSPNTEKPLPWPQGYTIKIVEKNIQDAQK